MSAHEQLFAVESAQRPESSRGWTYVVLDKPGEKFKVGTTTGDLADYIRGLEHRDGRPLELLAHFREGRDREQHCLKALSEWRLPLGEWFDWHEHSESDLIEYIRLHAGVRGWPRPQPPAPVAEIAAAEPAHHVQVTLPGFPYRRRPKSHLLRSQLDHRPMPETIATGEVAYYTPSVYVEAARRVMGAIDLDPASCEEANKVVGAAVFYDEEMDGLKQEWTGRVFLNPPWSGAASRFIRVLLAAYRKGRVVQAVVVLNATYTERKYMRELMESFPVCFTDHRVRYGGHGKSGTAGTMFVYLGKRVQSFVNAFTEFGPVMSRLTTSGEHKKG